MNLKNVLSLFDGISCGQVALKRLGCNFNMGGAITMPAKSTLTP